MIDHSIRLALIAGSAALGCAGDAFAQVQPPAPDKTTLEEVVVTAQRRSENLQSTPIAVTALSPQILDNRNVRTAQDLMQVAPSLQVSTQTAGDGGGSATFFLRGLGQQRAGNGSQPAVGIYVDDFYYPSLEGTVFNILDIQQVEVLRGPQGTLFGRNTIGGAIRYTSKKPEQSFGGYITGTVGSFERHDLTAVLNAPLGARAAARITLGSLNADGYVKSALTGKDVAGGDTNLGRVQLNWRPIDRLSIDVQAQHSKSDLDGYAYNLPGPFNHGVVTGIWNSIPPLGGVHPYDARYQSACFYCQPGTDESSHVTQDTVNAVVSFKITDEITLKSLTGQTRVQSHSLTDLDGTILPVLGLDTHSTTTARSQEFQLNGASLAGTIQWVSGVYLYDGSGHDAIVTTALAAPGPSNVTDRETKSTAGYADITWHATDKLSVLGGYRYSQEDQTAVAKVVSTISSTGSVTFDSRTGRIGVQYRWTPQVMSYATISQGFRGGGFNRLSNNTLQSFRPENDISYEVGARMDLFGRRLRLNPTAFYTNWTDIQVQRIQYILDANGNPTSSFLVLFDNAAKAHTFGLEMEADAALTDSLHMFGHLATLEAAYDDVTGAVGITLHSRLQRAPKFSYGLGATYTRYLPVGGSLVATANYSWQSDQASTPTDSDTLILPAYGLLNLRLEYRSEDRRWSVAGFATNLSDEKYYVGGVNYAESSPHYDIGRPRELGVTLRFQY